jgi:hypothetical protein
MEPALSKLIPNDISDCAVGVEGPVCTDIHTVSKIGKSLGVKSTDPKVIIDAAKEKLGCTDEKCVVHKSESVLGKQLANSIIELRFKPSGPTDNALLSNVNIDAIMKQWASLYEGFFPYNFNMRNYASFSFRDGHVLNTPDTLATIQFKDLYNGELGKKFTRVGCVINTDVYQGPGKHWMALYADSKSRTVEFFNSSGNSPSPEYVRWLEKTKIQMESLGIQASIKNNSAVRHQNSKSECGVYSLFYIYARLNGVPADFFSGGKIPDKWMFHFRQHLFEDPSRPTLEKFDWDEYQKKTNIVWE